MWLLANNNCRLYDDIAIGDGSNSGNREVVVWLHSYNISGN